MDDEDLRGEEEEEFWIRWCYTSTLCTEATWLGLVCVGEGEMTCGLAFLASGVFLHQSYQPQPASTEDFTWTPAHNRQFCGIEWKHQEMERHGDQRTSYKCSHVTSLTIKQGRITPSDWA